MRDVGNRDLGVSQSGRSGRRVCCGTVHGGNNVQLLRPFARPSPRSAASHSSHRIASLSTSTHADPIIILSIVRRVRRTALRLARSLSGAAPDLLTVELSALLHDVLDKKYVPPSSYGHNPRAFFEPFFKRAAAAAATALDLRADGRADVIVRIVENVSWSNEFRLRASGEWGPWHETCVELHCVQDADRLDAIGAFGECLCAACPTIKLTMKTFPLFQASCVAPHIALLQNGEVPCLLWCCGRVADFWSLGGNAYRTLLYYVCRPSALHVPDGDVDQPESAIQHFHDKLLHIRERMKTAPGKQMAEKRHQLVRTTNSSLFSPVNVCRSWSTFWLP